LTRAPRAVVVVTGSELVRGDRQDLNGPFVAQELLRLGIEPARILIVGDREEELAGALEEALRADLCVTSGGLGPTHDDRTVELVARAAGVGLRVDEELEQEIGGISRAFARRMGRPYVDFEQGVGYKHAKYLRALEFVASLDKIGRGKGGYWEDQGYEWYAGI
jgi:nicotinamide-nucleotide amidase